jgi:RNA polymerase sigma-70 factor (ECF subfamily)
MSDEPSSVLRLQGYLERMNAGDPAAREELFRHVAGRLERLTRKMLQGFPGVRRWEETGDVLQNAVVRLLRALGAVRPGSLREFFGLSAEQVRRELIDLARHYQGPQGAGAHHASQAGLDGERGPLADKPDLTHEPSALAGWAEFHQQVEGLPEEEREVVNLLFYQELPQAEAAALLGVTVRTVQRRWQSALLALHAVLKGHWPGL